MSEINAEINTAINTSISKQQARLESILLKKRELFEKQQANLIARMQAEQSKVRSLSMQDNGMLEVVGQVEVLASSLGVSNQKLLDFIAKRTVGETAKVLFRRPRAVKVPKQPRQPKVASEKTNAKAKQAVKK